MSYGIYIDINYKLYYIYIQIYINSLRVYLGILVYNIIYNTTRVTRLKSLYISSPQAITIVVYQLYILYYYIRANNCTIRVYTWSYCNMQRA